MSSGNSLDLHLRKTQFKTRSDHWLPI